MVIDRERKVRETRTEPCSTPHNVDISHHNIINKHCCDRPNKYDFKSCNTLAVIPVYLSNTKIGIMVNWVKRRRQIK